MRACVLEGKLSRGREGEPGGAGGYECINAMLRNAKDVCSGDSGSFLSEEDIVGSSCAEEGSTSCA